jgi:hypothetical protein
MMGPTAEAARDMRPPTFEFSVAIHGGGAGIAPSSTLAVAGMLPVYVTGESGEEIMR